MSINLTALQLTFDLIEGYAYNIYPRWKGKQLSDQIVQNGIQANCTMLEDFDAKELNQVFNSPYYEMSNFVNTEADVQSKFAAAFAVFVMHRYITVHTKAAPLNMDAATSLVLLCNKYLKG